MSDRIASRFASLDIVELDYLVACGHVDAFWVIGPTINKIEILIFELCILCKNCCRGANSTSFSNTRKIAYLRTIWPYIRLEMLFWTCPKRHTGRRANGGTVPSGAALSWRPGEIKTMLTLIHQRERKYKSPIYTLSTYDNIQYSGCQRLDILGVLLQALNLRP